ncbi:MAG: hypothetical protein KKB34_15025 [Bacteroidetes bacterium]|nr:hypothetical protein [Bacteroidota bacterium]
MGNAINLDEINKNYLVHFITDQIDTAEQVKHFTKFQFVIKRLVDKGYKFLSVTEDEFYLYFRIEQVISLLCYHLIQNEKIHKYQNLLDAYKNLQTVDERVKLFRQILDAITETELKNLSENIIYIEYI